MHDTASIAVARPLPTSQDPPGGAGMAGRRLGLTSYPDALAAMQARVAAIRAGTAAELVWLVEHPPLYTAGTSARPEELTDPRRFPTFAAGRGGQWTYHGPGQRTAYVMLDLTRPHGSVPARDIGCYVHGLEAWLIARAGPVRRARASAGRAGSASGWPIRSCRRPRPRSAPSACASAAG